MDNLNNLYLYTSIVLSILLIISEVLGWSKCDSNAISQLILCLKKVDPLVPPEIEPIIRISESIAESLEEINKIHHTQ